MIEKKSDSGVSRWRLKQASEAIAIVVSLPLIGFAARYLGGHFASEDRSGSKNPTGSSVATGLFDGGVAQLIGTLLAMVITVGIVLVSIALLRYRDRLLAKLEDIGKENEAECKGNDLTRPGSGKGVRCRRGKRVSDGLD